MDCSLKNLFTTPLSNPNYLLPFVFILNNFYCEFMPFINWLFLEIKFMKRHHQAKTILTTKKKTFMAYHRICDKSNRTGAISGAEPVYHSGAQKLTFVLLWCFVQSVLCFVDHCLSFSPFFFCHYIVRSCFIYGI